MERVPPVSNFAKNYARGPRGLLGIAPRDLIPPPPGAHTCRAGHMSVVTISAHAHASTHSDEALRQTSSSETQQQAAARAQRHTNRTGISATCHSFVAPAHKSRRVAHVWLVLALCRTYEEQPLQASQANVAPNSPKSCQAKWFQTFQAGFAPVFISRPQALCAHLRYCPSTNPARPNAAVDGSHSIRPCCREKLHKPCCQITLPGYTITTAPFSLYRKLLRRLFLFVR